MTFENRSNTLATPIARQGHNKRARERAERHIVRCGRPVHTVRESAPGGVVDTRMGCVKYSTAVARLRQVAGDLADHASSWGDPIIVEAHVFGDMLTGPDTVDVIWLALVVDLPVDEVTWLARPARAEAAASLLRFDKYPLRWRWRPNGWPVWNPKISRPVRFWSRHDGPDEVALDLLAARRLSDLEYQGPPGESAYRAQLETERETARRHLEQVVDSYHDRTWRRDRKGFGVYPEDHLWWATRGWLELDDALRAFDGPDQPV